MTNARHLKTEPLPFASRAISIKAFDGSLVRCHVSEVLAALIEFEGMLTTPQVSLCRRFFSRLNLKRCPIIKAHS